MEVADYQVAKGKASPRGCSTPEVWIGQAGKLQNSPTRFAFEFEPDQELVRDQSVQIWMSTALLAASNNFFRTAVD
jgi:hypothetical protein